MKGAAKNFLLKKGAVNQKRLRTTDSTFYTEQYSFLWQIIFPYI